MATPETETIWLGATKEMNTREVEQVVSGHRLGDVPTDPVDPKLQLQTLRFDVTGEVAGARAQAKLDVRKIRGAVAVGQRVSGGGVSRVHRRPRRGRERRMLEQ